MPYTSRRAMRVFLPTCILVSLIAACEKGAVPAAAPSAEAPSSDVPSAVAKTDAPAISQKSTYKVDITAEEAKVLLDEDSEYVYLDVRSVAEFEGGHVPGAMNIPWIAWFADRKELDSNTDYMQIVSATFSQDAKIIIGCRAGSRSRNAQAEMMNAGFSRVSNVKGGFTGGKGYTGWSSLGYPVEAGDGGDNSYTAIRAKVMP